MPTYAYSAYLRYNFSVKIRSVGYCSGSKLALFPTAHIVISPQSFSLEIWGPYRVDP
jgi:hypothetical protein